MSRSGKLPANAIYRRLRASGYDAIPVNPGAATVEGVPCYLDLGSIPGPVDRVIVATHPDVSLQVVRQCAERGVKQVWFHRSFGNGSVSLAAGLALQREAPEPSFDDLRVELDLYLNDELQDLKDRAKLQEEKELDLYRKIALIGAGVTVLAISSGTLNNPGNRGLQYSVGAVSAAVALAGFGLYLVRSGEMKECREFLDRGGQDLSAWGRLHLVLSREKVPRALWLDYVDRVAALRAHETCLRIR